MPRQRLGFGGFTPGAQRQFTAAAAGGQDAFNQYMAKHAGIAGRLGRLEKSPQSAQGQAWSAFQKQYGLTAQTAPPPSNPATAPNANAGATAPVTPTSPTTQDPNWYKNFISQYEIPTPAELTNASQYATQNLNRLGAMPLPSYEEQFNTYSDLMKRELDKQTADLTESYGARGARYTSDLTTASADMRRKGLQDLSAQGITAMQTLNQQRMQELAGSLGVMQNVGASRANIATNAASTAWQNYLQGTAPPELMNQMLSWSSAFSPPGSVVTQG